MFEILDQWPERTNQQAERDNKWARERNRRVEE